TAAARVRPTESTGPPARLPAIPPAFQGDTPRPIRARITHPQPRSTAMMDETDILSDLDQLRSRYHVLRQLGHDGGCPVYAVRGHDSDRHCLVKVMAKPGSGSAYAGTLHLWQAHTMERLEHPKL